jgi:hypothetical protein
LIPKKLRVSLAKLPKKLRVSLANQLPWRRAARARRTSPVPALRWPTRLGFASGRVSATCVIHLGP